MKRFHIGCVWAGSDMQDIERWRRMTVEHFLELYRVPGIQLYSLQKGPRAQDLHTAGAVSLIKDLSPFINDVCDTVSIMRHLDLVITIETSVGHMAAAAGVPCWVFCSRHGADFRIGRSGDKPLWYDKHRLFRQGDDGEWKPVVERVVEALRERVG